MLDLQIWCLACHACESLPLINASLSTCTLEVDFFPIPVGRARQGDGNITTPLKVDGIGVEKVLADCQRTVLFIPVVFYQAVNQSLTPDPTCVLLVSYICCIP